MIMDEPTASLAARQVQGVLTHVRAAADAGHAIILVTHNYLIAHNYAQARSIADDILVLARGSVVGSFNPQRAVGRRVMNLVSQ
jgi:ABC-type sugar transport system ATPase subunit